VNQRGPGFAPTGDDPATIKPTISETDSLGAEPQSGTSGQESGTPVAPPFFLPSEEDDQVLECLETMALRYLELREEYQRLRDRNRLLEEQNGTEQD